MNRNIYKSNEIMGDEITLKAETVEEKSRRRGKGAQIIQVTKKIHGKIYLMPNGSSVSLNANILDALIKRQKLYYWIQKRELICFKYKNIEK